MYTSYINYYAMTTLGMMSQKSYQMVPQRNTLFTKKSVSVAVQCSRVQKQGLSLFN